MPPLTPGSRLGRYEVRTKLGSGGMGDVYLAEDSQLGRRVALKVLLAEDQADPHARKRLEREARAAATLDHPHICAVYEVGEADGVAFIAMQYVEGQTLAARMAKGPLGLGETLEIATQVTDALAEAHERGVLHRDIKPANIMLTPKGQAKVMDFGLAKVGRAQGAGEAATVSGLTQPGAIMGTIPYMSPEQVRASDLDQRSDLFSAGIVFYEMICGRRPFDESSSAATASAILTREPLPIARFAPETPPELERIVAKALRKNPEERYQTAKDLLVDLRALRDEHSFQARLERTTPSTDRSAPVPAPSGAVVRQRPGRPYAWIAGVVVLIAIAGLGWWLKQHAETNAVLAKVPQVAALAEANRYFEAYDLALEVESLRPGDAAIAGLLPTIADTLSVTSDPPGAKVFLKRFSADASRRPERQLVGTTPLQNQRIARGQYVLNVELDGYALYERTVSGETIRQGSITVTPPPIRVSARLVTASDRPANMVFVPGSNYRMAGWSRPTDRLVPLSDFFIDTFEVSNQDFKEFITAGGYVKREFWTHRFVKDGRELSWEQAMAQFVDRSGLPGPRGWSGQNLPEGKADHPVTDVTWYEAAAYAAFRGKQLPTVFQWEKAARNGVVGPAGVAIMPWGLFYPGDSLDDRANFGTATWPVTNAEFGMSWFGARNMAGNVAEWTMNDSSTGYLATGGAWGDPTYTFSLFGGRPAFFSSNKLGFRLAKNAAGAAGDQGGARIEIKEEIPDYTPTSDAQFNTYAAAYKYDSAAPLDARIEESIETPDWKREKISFNGADGERAVAYLYTPHHVPRPLQVVHYVPAADVDGGFRTLTSSMEDRLAPFIKSGRAAFGVLLAGYVGRLRPDGTPMVDSTTVEFYERAFNRMTDLRRGLDYIATRPDLDRSRVALYGPSAGSSVGLILAAIEPRYRGFLMSGAGLPIGWIPVIPKANPINFASHIRMPTLVIQGRYDEDSPLATASDPLFKLLPEPKRRVLFDGGHVPPLEMMATTAIPWFDETMGRVVR